MRKLTHLQELIADTTSDAMSGAQDMDTGITQLARAASIVLADDLHDILLDELKRIAGICGPAGAANFSIRSNASRGFEVAITVYPNGDSRPSCNTSFATSLPEAIAKAETEAAKWVQSHRVMCADDLGIAA